MSIIASKKTAIIDYFARMTAVSLAGNFVSFFSGVVVARVLGPEQYGLLSYLLVFQQWGAFVGLGFMSVAARNLPILIGKGETGEMQDIRNNCYTIELIMLSAYYVSVLAFFGSTNTSLVPYFLLITAVAFMQKQQEFYSTELYASKRFNVIVPATFWGATISATVAIVLVYLIGVYGPLLGYLTAAVFQYVYFRIRNPFHLSLNIQAEKAKGYFKIATPLYLTTLSFWAMRLLDKTIIASFLAKEVLGFYSFAATISLAMQSLVDTVNRVFQPYFFQKYGQEGSMEKMEQYVEEPLWVLTYATPLAIALGYLLLPILVNTFLPQYAPSIAVFNILVFSMFFFALTPPYNFQMNMQGKLYSIAATQFSSVVLNVALSLTAIKLGYGMVGVAWATLASWALYSVLIAVMAKRVKHLFRPMRFLPFLLVLIVYYIYRNLGLLYAIPLLTIGYVPLIIILNRKTGVFTAVYNHYLKRRYRKERL